MHSLAVRRVTAVVATRAAASSSARSNRNSNSRRAPSSSSRSSPLSPLSSILLQRQLSRLALPRHAPAQHHHQHVRCYASRKEEDKSWGEIAEDAAEVAKGALKKLGLGALTAVEKVLGGGGGGKSPTSSSSSTSQQRQRPRPGDEGEGDSFWGPMSRRESERGGGPLTGGGGGGGGLLGSLVGGVLGKAVQGAFSAIAEQSREAGFLADSALDAANADSSVREEFGGALERASGSGLGSMAQSSSTVVVNGRARKSTSVSFPVMGPRGGGFLEATSTSDGKGGTGDEVVVRVRSQRGRMIVVNGGGGRGSGGSGGSGGRGGSSGDVIDVDFREV